MILGRIRSHGYFLAFFGALFVYFLWPLIVLKKTFILGDYGLQFFPWSHLYAEGLKRGQLPYWTPLMANGFPLVAEGQVGAYYPLNLLGFLLLPVEAAYTWGILLHFLLGGVGFYVYGQKIGLSKEASALSAVLFSFSSAYGGCFYNIVTVRVLTWLPYGLIALENIAAGKKPSFWTGLLSAFIAMMWTAGFPQMAVYALLYLSIYAAFKKSVFRCLAAFAMANLFALVLASPQLYATWQLIGQSTRSSGDAAFALWGSVPPPAALSLVFPEWGNFLRVSFYIGILPLFFALIGAATKKERAEKVHWGLAVIFFLLALGKYNPLYAFAVKTFSLTALRNPSKFLFFSTVSLAIAAGFGMQKALAGREEGKWKKIVGISAVFFALVPALASAVFHLYGDALRAYGARLALEIFASKSDPAHGVEHYWQIIGGMLDRLGPLVSPLNAWNLLALGWIALSVILFLRRTKGFKYAAAAMIGLDLVLFAHFYGAGFLGNIAKTDAVATQSVSEVLSLRPLSGGTLAEWSKGPEDELLAPNSNLLYLAPHAGGYSPLLLKRYYELTRDLGIVDASLGRRPMRLEVWQKERGLIDALGIETLISGEEIGLPGFESAGKAAGRRIYANKAALPPLVVMYDWKKLEDADQRLAYLKSERFHPASQAVVESDAPFQAHAGMDASLPLEWHKDEIGLSASVNAKERGLAVIRSAYYPAIKAKVDGAPQKIVPVNHAFSGVYLTQGVHRLHLFYDTSKNRAFELLSLLAWFALFISFWRLRSR